MVLEVWRRTWAQSGDNSKGDLAGHVIKSLFLDNQFQHLQSQLHHCCILIACDRLQRTREDKQCWGQTASPQSCWSQCKVLLKYYASTLTESKEGAKCAESGSDGLPCMMDVLGNWGCLHTVRNLSISHSSSLSFNQLPQSLASWWDVVFLSHT